MSLGEKKQIVSLKKSIINKKRKLRKGLNKGVMSTEKLWKHPGEIIVSEVKPEYKARKVFNNSQKHV